MQQSKIAPQRALFSSMYRRRALAVAGLVAMLAAGGCGFHLQGRSVLPDNIEQMGVLYDNDYTVGDPEVVRVIEQRLRQRDQLGSATSPALLRIVKVNQNQRTIAVSPVDGDAAVYQLTVQVIYNYSVNDVPRLSGERVVAVRDFSVEATQRLSIEDQRRHNLEQMQTGLADQILERISQANQAAADRPAGSQQTLTIDKSNG